MNPASRSAFVDGVQAPGQRLGRVAVLAAVFTLVLASPSRCGPNAGGAMVVHVADAYSYTYSGEDRCSTPYVQSVASCADVVTRSDEGQTVVWLLAAFAPHSSPRVGALRCKISYGPDVEIEDSWMCGGALEIPDLDWPASQSHNAIAFNPPVMGDIIFPFYGLRVWNWGGADAFFCTETDTATAFADEFTEDPCERSGCVRWYAEGSKECPGGACCDSVGVCEVSSEGWCLANGWEWLGEGTSCTPNPCSPPGACCFLDTSCRDVTEFWCERINGTFLGWGGSLCESGVCWPVEPGICCIEDLCFGCSETVCLDQGGAWFPTGTWPEPCIYPGCAIVSLETEPRMSSSPDICAVSPNPARGALNYSIHVPEPAAVRVDLFDPCGRLVAGLLSRDLPAGRHAFVWDPGGNPTPRIASGVYSLRLEATPLPASPGAAPEGQLRRTTRSVVLLK